jgi:hypothetical protein
MITRSKLSSLLSNSVTESKDKRYRHQRIIIYANKLNEFATELTLYMQKAHEDAKQHIRKVLGNSLDPLAPSTEVDPDEGYPQSLDMSTLKGYFGEVFAGLIAEHCAPFGENNWKVPAFLFRFHEAAFQHLELLRQTDTEPHPIPGRTGDDCLAFQMDNKGQINRSLFCEAKCTASHDSHLINDAHEKVSKAVLVDIPRVIEVLLDSTDPDAPKWIEALKQLRLRPIPEHERCDLVSYVCRRPGPGERRVRLPLDKPHRKYTARRRLEAVEVHLPDVESLIREVYGIKDLTEVLASEISPNEDYDRDI